jgi:hypothetical protein
MSGFPTDSGARLQRIWSIPARQTRYHKDGNFYMPLTMWPGALADPAGYVVFQTEEDMKRFSPVHYTGRGSHNLRLNVLGGISSLPTYRKKPTS